MSAKPLSPTRRDFLATAAAVGMAGLSARSLQAADDAAPPRSSLGMVINSYGIRSRVEKDAGFSEPLQFLEFCRKRGAAGVQLPLGVPDAPTIAAIRKACEKHDLFVEGSIRTPRDTGDVERFEAEIAAARACGATVVRTVMLGGRRYETFQTNDEYKTFLRKAWESITLAEAVVAKHGVRLAVENHKDLSTDELIDWMKRLSSAHVGITVDTGNNLAFLEEPNTTAERLAPWVASVHLKDMAVGEYEGGILIAEVPLGEGIVDVPHVVDVLRRANPQLRISLEMITRDPLRVPCLSHRYWNVMSELRGADLAAMLRLARGPSKSKKLPQIENLPLAEQVAAEEAHVVRSLEFARRRLKG